MDNLVGKRLGAYDVRSLLGRGGMGAVYIATQTSLKRQVAVKVTVGDLTGDATYRERFSREAELVARLEHSHIVHIYDFGYARPYYYIVMQYVSGGSLGQRLEYYNRLGRALPSMDELSRFVSEIGSALDYAHSEGVLHRDIKPGNIIFGQHGKPYLADFGIAKEIGASHSLTVTGTAMGSPSYMPPEQWQGRPLTGAADQYAFAVTVFQCLTGQPPFRADSAAQLMYLHINEPPPSLSLHRPDLPVALNAILRRAMAKDPAARFPTLADFSSAFAAAVAGAPGVPTGFFSFPLPASAPTSQGNLTPDIRRTPLFAYGAGQAARTGLAAVIRWLKAQPPRNVAVALTAFVAFILIFLLIGRGGGEAATAEVPPTARAIVLLETATDTPSRTSQPEAKPTATADVLPSETVAEPALPSPTATLDLALAAVATRDAMTTLTATHLAAASTEDAEATIAAMVAALLVSDLTSTAAAASPTSSPTLTPSATASPTSSPTASATPSPTASPTPTASATTTATSTASDTATPRDTETPTASLTRNPSHTPSATSTNTRLPSATWMPSLTSTVTSSPTPTSSPTATVTPVIGVRLTINSNVGINLRVSDSTGARVVTTMPLGTTGEIIGINPGRTWYYVRLDESNRIGWVSRQVESQMIVVGEISGLAVIVAPSLTPAPFVPTSPSVPTTSSGGEPQPQQPQPTSPPAATEPPPASPTPFLP